MGQRDSQFLLLPWGMELYRIYLTIWQHTTQQSDAFRSRHPEVHFGLYYSLFEWFNPMYLKDKANKFSTRHEK